MRGFLGRTLWQKALVGVLAFSLGGATVAQAVAPGGIMGTIRIADATDDTHLAAVDASGNVAVKISSLPANEPAQINFSRTFPTTGNSFVNDLYTVPAAKRLVIEYIHARASEPLGQQVSCGLTGQQSSQPWSLRLPLEFTASLTQFQSPPDVWTADVTARLYLEAGGTLRFSCIDDFAVHNQLRTAAVIVSGYLVSVP